MVTEQQEKIHFNRLIELKRQQRKPPYDCQICTGLFSCFKKTTCCNQSICKDCISRLPGFSCPFCRHKMSDLDDMLSDILLAQELETEEKLRLKDYVTSRYLDMYPEINSENIYSALVYLEDPILLLELNPEQVDQLLRSL